MADDLVLIGSSALLAFAAAMSRANDANKARESARKDRKWKH